MLMIPSDSHEDLWCRYSSTSISFAILPGAAASRASTSFKDMHLKDGCLETHDIPGESAELRGSVGAQILYALVEQGLKKYDVQQYGVAQYLFATGPFWFVVLACGLISFGHRIIERGYVWLLRPQVLRAPPSNPPFHALLPSRRPGNTPRPTSSHGPLSSRPTSRTCRWGGVTPRHRPLGPRCCREAELSPQRCQPTHGAHRTHALLQG